MFRSSRGIVFLTALVGGFWGVMDGFFVFPMVNICAVVLGLLFIFHKQKYGLWTRMWQDNFITLFMVCLLSNFIACWINRGQSILQSIYNVEVKNMLLIFFFYLLLKLKNDIIVVEKSIVVLYFIFIACFFFQYFIFYPEPVFRMIGVNIESILDRDTEHRFRLASQAIGFLGYFFLLNRVLTEKAPPKWYYVGVVLGFLFVVLLGFRSETIAIIVSSIYMVFRVRGFRLEMLTYAISFGIILIVLCQIPQVQKQVNNMIERQMGGQNYQNSDYVRNTQLYYFLYEHSVNTSDYFFGSGLPSPKSRYGKKWADQTTETGSYNQQMTISMYGWVDWGVVGLSWMAGMPLGILLYWFMFFMVLRNYGKRNLYISSLYLFLLFTSVTTIEFYRQGAYIYHAIILYITTILDKRMSIKFTEKHNKNGKSVEKRMSYKQYA